MPAANTAITATFKSILSIEENNDEISIYPNPATDYIIIASSNSEKKNEIYSDWAIAVLKDDQAAADSFHKNSSITKEEIISQLYIYGDWGIYFMMMGIY